MAMKLVDLFLAGEEDDFGFELFTVDAEDLALSQWELVDHSDADSDRSDPVTDVESPSAISDVVPALSQPTLPWASAAPASGSPFPDTADQCLDRAGDPIPSLDQLMLAVAEYCQQFRDQGCGGDGEDLGGDYRENEDDDGDDGLDDELVPWHLRGKLGRQRMRKLGKRACSKMNTSKRSPHLYVKSGCLYGKHGLGLKRSLC